MYFTRKIIIWTLIIVCVSTTVIIPTVYYIGNSLNGGDTSISNLLLNAFFTFLVSISITTANLLTFRYFENRSTGHKGYLKRFAIELFLTSINAAAIISAIVYFFYFAFGQLPDKDSPTTGGVLFENILVAVIVNIIVSGLAQAYIFFTKWKSSILESERLQREKAESQYAALRNQVNPHFLFNSLNSLSSLISISPEKAIDFVDKFSKIYRYVLDVSDKSLVELKMELDFLKSFFFLQQIRFGNNINLKVNISEKFMNSYIPPLSMQLLIENAIKHNEVSSENPLYITIYTENQFLVITNNLQLKNTLEESTGIGINNLKQRYLHYTDLKPDFYCTVNEYIAKIPLISDTE